MKIIVDKMPNEPKECIFLNVQISCVVIMHVIYTKEEDVNLIDVIFKANCRLSCG